MKFTQALVAAFLLLIAVPVRAQQAASPQTESARKWFQAMLGGQWEGKTIDGRNSVSFYESTLGGRFLRLQRSTDEGQALGLVGLDPASGELTYWMWNSEGGVGAYALKEVKAGVWIFRGTSDGPEGESSAEFRSTLTSDKLVSAVSGKRSGEPFEVMTEAIRKPRPEPPAPKLQVASEAPAEVPGAASRLQQVVGVYFNPGSDFTNTDDHGLSRATWILDGKFLLYVNTGVGPDLQPQSYLAILGVNPRTKEFTGWEFSSSGGVGQYVVSPEGDALKGGFQFPDGRKATYQGELDDSPDAVMVIRGEGALDGGPPQAYGYRWLRIQN